MSEEEIFKRMEDLLVQGQPFIRAHSDEYWTRDIGAAQAWMSSVANVVLQVSPLDSFYRAEIARLTTHEHLDSGIPIHVLQKVHGVLRSVLEEARAGLLAKLEYQIFATAFDDFLDHAVDFHKSGKIKEAGILAAVLLEDTLKRVAKKNGLNPAGVSLEPLVDELVRANVFTPVKAKRMKSFAGVRYAALHAEWDKLDLKDVGNVLDGIRELLDGYL